jgi:hypothetical protein
MDESKSSRMKSLVRLFLTIDLVTLILAALTTLAGLLLGWKTGLQFSTGFFMVGAFCVVIGVFSVLGGTYGRGDFKYQYTRTASNASSDERTSQLISEMAQGYRFAVLMSVVGLLLIGLSLLAPTLIR